MLSSVLNSWRAVEVNVLIMRAFVRLRQMAGSHKDLLVKIEEMEKRYDAQFKVVFDAIRRLMAPLRLLKRRSAPSFGKSGQHMGDDDSDVKSFKLKPGTHYVSNLEPRSSILFFYLGTLYRLSFAFFAPWREMAPGKVFFHPFDERVSWVLAGRKNM